MRVDAVEYGAAIARVLRWAGAGQSRYVGVATVNNVMESYDCGGFRAVMNEADLVTSDGMPLVWALRLLGVQHAMRVYGPDLMERLLAAAADGGVACGLYGSSPEVLSKLVDRIGLRFPKVRMSYCWSPPFRPLTPEEDELITAEINSSGTRILFVGLNTPKQDCWMASHKGRVQCVMIGVGAAFEFLAGTKPQAPRWMMRCGLEWSFRLATEPRRLWKRYLKHNPRFVAFFALQLLGLRRYGSGEKRAGLA